MSQTSAIRILVWQSDEHRPCAHTQNAALYRARGIPFVSYVYRLLPFYAGARQPAGVADRGVAYRGAA